MQLGVFDGSGSASGGKATTEEKRIGDWVRDYVWSRSRGPEDTQRKIKDVPSGELALGSHVNTEKYGETEFGDLINQIGGAGCIFSKRLLIVWRKTD